MRELILKVQEKINEVGMPELVFPALHELTSNVTAWLFHPPISHREVTQMVQNFHAFMGIFETLDAINRPLLSNEVANQLAQCANIFIFTILRAGIQKNMDFLSSADMKKKYSGLFINIKSPRAAVPEHKLFHMHMDCALNGLKSTELFSCYDKLNLGDMVQLLEAGVSGDKIQCALTAFQLFTSLLKELLATNIEKDFLHVYILMNMLAIIESESSLERKSQELRDLIAHEQDTRSILIFCMRLYILNVVILHNRSSHINLSLLAESEIGRYVEGSKRDDILNPSNFSWTWQWAGLGRKECQTILLLLLQKLYEDFQTDNIHTMLSILDPCTQKKEVAVPPQDKNLLTQLRFLNGFVQKTTVNQFLEEQSVIVVIGNTRSGKSTTIDMLMHPDVPRENRPVIGCRIGKSQTRVPEIFMDGEDSTQLYVDVAGFLHTKQKEKPAISLLMESMVRSHRVKGILIMIDTRSFSDGAMALKELFLTLGDLLKNNYFLIENYCVFGITHLLPGPLSDNDVESIYSLDSLSRVLDDLLKGFEEDLQEEMQTLVENACQQYEGDVDTETNFPVVQAMSESSSNSSSKESYDLTVKILTIKMLQRALCAGRVVLVYNTFDQKEQSCQHLRQQFRLFPENNNLSDTLYFERYDKERKELMDQIQEQSIEIIQVLENEANLMRQYHFLQVSDNQEKSEERIAELTKEIDQKKEELTIISSRETADEPYWEPTLTSSNYYYSKEEVEHFIYRKSAPVSQVILSTKNLRYSNLASAQIIPRFKDMIANIYDSSTGEFAKDGVTSYSFAISVLATLCTPMGMPIDMALSLVGDIVRVGKTTVINAVKPSQYTDMHWGERFENLSVADWKASIQLPEQIEPKHAIFSVKFKHLAQSYIRPIVKVYVPICYMSGNPEKIQTLKNLLPVLEQQKQEVEKKLQQYIKIVQGITENKIQQELQEEKTVLLTYLQNEIRPFSEWIEQKREMIQLICDIFMSLNISLKNYGSIENLIKLWTEREDRVVLMDQVGEENKQDSEVKAVLQKDLKKDAIRQAYFSKRSSGILFKSSITPKIFYATMNGENQHFHLKGIDGDGDCGFKALGIKREQLAELLQIHAENPAVRNRFCMPMRENLKTLKHPLFSLVEDGEIKLQALNSEAEKKILGFPELSELDGSKIRSTERVQWLKDNGHSETAQILEQKLIELQQAETLFEEYLQSPSAFESYITGLRNNLWIDTESIRFYAEQHRWTVRIWMQAQGTLCLNRDLHAGHEEVNAVQTHDILFNGTHYDRLVLQQTPENHEQARATMVASVSF